MLSDALRRCSHAHPAGFREIAAREAQTHLGALRLVDVRESDEFVGELGHVAGAALTPLRTVPAVCSTWGRDEAILLICRSGARSGQAAAFLARQGFSAVFNLTGGMISWNGHGLPIVR